MKKVLIGVMICAGLLWVIFGLGDGAAIAWGFGLVVGAFLAVLAIRALFATSAITAVVAVNEAAKALSTPQKLPTPPKESSQLETVNNKRASYGLPLLSSLEQPARPQSSPEDYELRWNEEMGINEWVKKR